MFVKLRISFQVLLSSKILERPTQQSKVYAVDRLKTGHMTLGLPSTVTQHPVAGLISLLIVLK
jgi:hypothetical protein